MPSLYLPDAISLTLLIIELTLLRQAAVAHCRQEAQRLQVDLLLYWSDRGLPPNHEAYDILRTQFHNAFELSAGISPARLFFAHRRFRKFCAGPYQPHLRQWSLESGLRTLNDPKVRQRLRKVQLEFDISLGMFLLLGSVSGWLMAGAVLSRLFRRMLSRRRANPMDWGFDLMERLLSHLGRRSLRLRLLSQQPN